jgi:hypothetical protein
MKLKLIAAVATVGFFHIGLLGGHVLAAPFSYSQPHVNGSDGGPFCNDPTQLIADRFIVPAGGVTIGQVSWFGAADSNPTLPFSAFNIEFFGDSSGTPGTLLTNITIASPAIVDTGLINFYGNTVLRFSTTIPDVVLGAGTYYFSVSDSGPNNFVWASSNLSNGGFYRVNNGPWNDLSSDPNRASQAFSLEGDTAVTPLPAALPLFATGLGALGLLGWRRKQKNAAA